MISIEYVGYLAALLMFSTFYMKRMIPLRAVGICSNVTFIVYAGLYPIFTGGSPIWPLFLLHVCLCPLNVMRMVQMMRLVKKVKEASKGEFNMDFMVPFMNKETFSKGDVVFKKGDQADKLYYLQSGSIRLEEIDKVLAEGEVIGEMGIFSPEKVRTATVVCETDVVLFNIPESKVTEIYFQNPEFGFYLVQLILKRVAARSTA